MANILHKKDGPAIETARRFGLLIIFCLYGVRIKANTHKQKANHYKQTLLLIQYIAKYAR
jgi:hypothetical protein